MDSQDVTIKARILVADNDPNFRQVFSQMLKLRGYETTIASTPQEVYDMVRDSQFDLLTLDLDWGLDGMNGIDILMKVLKSDPLLPVVMITEYASIPTAVEATKKGALDYVEKMLDREKTLLTLRTAIETGRLKRANQAYLTEIKKNYQIIGSSTAIGNLKNQIEKVAPTDSVVLITGPSGTGKELVARQIHYNSQRCHRQFVSVDSGTLADSLAESELFGHCKGAFTGATKDRKGLFEEAEKGTLFLDEITNASLQLQAKLLHVLQEREFRRIGENATHACDVRIIAASNRYLPDLITQDRFREDLYYRLKVIEIEIPPLREHKEDIPELVRHFVELKSRQSGYKGRTLSVEGVNLLLDYDWPGNVRELENAIERIVVLSNDDTIFADEVKSIMGEMWLDKASSIKSLNEMTREFKRECIIKAINLAEGKIARAAEILQIDRTHLYKLVNEFQLKDN